MRFDYSDFCSYELNYPDSFNASMDVDVCEYNKLQDKYDKDGDIVERTMRELQRRTTPDYFGKVYIAQTRALCYSKKVFPTYKFIMPDTLADDWLSTVDWHKRYPTRDHSLHQAQTSYIVAKLLGNGKEKDSLEIPDNNSNLLAYCIEKMLSGDRMLYFRNYAKSLGIDIEKMPETIKRRWAKNVFYETAVIAALFHDMGYPWQYVNKLSESIEVAEYEDATNVVCSVTKTKESIKNRLLIYPFYGYSETNLKHASVKQEKMTNELIEKGLRNTHGLPGALGFMCLNDKIRKFSQIPTFREASYRLILDWAAVGIMMHDMTSIYWGDKKEKIKPKNPILRLSFDIDPISSIISMADILEEFYRPSAHFKNVLFENNDEDKNKDKGLVQAVQLDYGFPCKGTSVYVNENTLYIRYQYDNKENAVLNKKRRKDEVFEYFNADNGFVDLSSLGIKRVDCDTEFAKKSSQNT